MKPAHPLLVILCLALQSACTGAEPAQLTGEGNLPVIRYVDFRVYDPVYVALDQGMFERHGIRVEIIGDTLAGPTAIQAVSSGAAEAGLSSLPALVNANAAGLPVIGVSDIQSALPGQPLEYYYVRADSDIHSVEDLPGRTFAVNLWHSSFHYTALMALEQHEIVEDKVEWVLLPFDTQAQALTEGEVDVIGLMEPHNSYALATYGSEMRLLFDAADVFGEKQFSTHFVNRIWAENNPEQARAFVDGVVEAILWIEEHPEAAKQIVANYTEVPEAYIPDYQFQENGQVVMDDVRFWLDYLLSRDDIEADWLTVEMIATNEYNSRINPVDEE